MAVTAVELIVAPRAQTTVISSTSNRVSLLPAVLMSQSPKPRATPVRTRPSPMTKRAAMRTMLGSAKPARASPIVRTGFSPVRVPANGRSVSMMSATASMRGRSIANITIAAAKSSRTTTSEPVMSCRSYGVPRPRRGFAYADGATAYRRSWVPSYSPTGGIFPGGGDWQDAQKCD